MTKSELFCTSNGAREGTVKVKQEARTRWEWEGAFAFIENPHLDDWVPHYQFEVVPACVRDDTPVRRLVDVTIHERSGQ